MLRPALLLLLFFTLLTGVLYPLALTGAAQLLFSAKANGSLLQRDGVVIGSELVGQHFDDPRYFWGRPSATARHPYDAAASSGSNLGPLNPALHGAVRERIAALRAAHGGAPDVPIPMDLLTTSGSGLDPDISIAAAEYQVGRVAAARALSGQEVSALVQQCTQWRTLGVLGEPRVNVLRLNLALDAQTGQRKKPG